MLPCGGNYTKRGKPIERNFKTQILPIEQGSWVYMYTDGYIDQFGGEEGRVMNYKLFEGLLLEANKLEGAVQQNMLEDHLKKWKGDYEQNDDVLVMGFKV